MRESRIIISREERMNLEEARVNVDRPLMPQVFEVGSSTRRMRNINDSNSTGNKVNAPVGVTPIRRARTAAKSLNMATDVHDIAHYGIPEGVCDAYASKGIKKLYAWQAECIEKTKVLENKNVVYTAPTNGGKTLVSELAVIHCVTVLGKSALFVVPFVALANEKSEHFSSVLSSTGIQVLCYAGDRHVNMVQCNMMMMYVITRVPSGRSRVSSYAPWRRPVVCC